MIKCSHKTAWGSEAETRAEIARLDAVDPKGVKRKRVPYRCPQCTRWHFSTMTQETEMWRPATREEILAVRAKQSARIASGNRIGSAGFVNVPRVAVWR